MTIIKVAVGNANESFIESRFSNGVNIIFSNDNNKGKTIILQGMMFALGNDPLFPSGFNYKEYYFYVCFEHEGANYEFVRKNNSATIKYNGNIHILDTSSELKRFIDKNIFSLPKIVKDDYLKTVDLSLLYQLFFVAQDKRNPSGLINISYYNKSDFMNMVYSMAECLLLPETTEKLKQIKDSLRKCKYEIEAIHRKLKFYNEHPELANIVSNAVNKEQAEVRKEELSEINSRITELEKGRLRTLNRKTKLDGLLSELNSLNLSLQSGNVLCKDCGSKNIIYNNADLSFELTNDLVRKNIKESIMESIKEYDIQVQEYCQQIAEMQRQLRTHLSETPKSWVDILLYAEEIKSSAENESQLDRLLAERDDIEFQIESEQYAQDANIQKQKDVKDQILETMNTLYKEVDPKGNQSFKDIFATRNITFSGSEEQEYYYSRTLAIYKLLQYDFPIVMDCFRQGELSTKKEDVMLAEYVKTSQQVILTSTLKDEEFQSGEKYYSIEGVNAINYETNETSKILQPDTDEFMQIISSFGISI